MRAYRILDNLADLRNPADAVVLTHRRFARAELADRESRPSPDGQWLALPLTDGFATNILDGLRGDRRVASGDRFRRSCDFHRCVTS